MARKRVLAQPDPPVLADASDAEWSEETRKRRMRKPEKPKRKPAGIVAKQGPSKFAADDGIAGLDDDERRVARHDIIKITNYIFISLFI